MLETLMVTFEEACPAAFPSLLPEYFALTDCQSHGEPASEILCQLSKVIFGARKETTPISTREAGIFCLQVDFLVVMCCCCCWPL